MEREKVMLLLQLLLRGRADPAGGTRGGHHRAHTNTLVGWDRGVVPRCNQMRSWNTLKYDERANEDIKAMLFGLLTNKDDFHMPSDDPTRA